MPSVCLLALSAGVALFVGPSAVSQVSATAAGTQAETAKRARCHPNYRPCIRMTRADWDCSELPKGVVYRIVGRDAYRLDRDGDRLGCEKN